MTWGISRPKVRQTKPINRMATPRPTQAPAQRQYDTNKAYFDWMNQTHNTQVDDVLEVFMKEREADRNDT